MEKTLLDNDISGALLRAPRPGDPSTLFQHMVGSVTEYAIFALDPEGRVLTWNPGAERILQYSEREVIGLPMRIFFTPADISAGVPDDEIRHAIANGSTVDERWHVRKDGTRFWASGVLTAIREGGQTVAFSKLLRDNTDKKLAEMQLKNKARQLARSNEELERFAYVASHDLKEPLRTIGTYVQLIQRKSQGTLSPQVESYVTTVTDGVKRMYSLIDDILAFARAGSAAGHPEPIDCNRLIDQLITTLATGIQERGAVVSRGNLPSVVAWRASVLQLFQNLIGNGLKFSKAEVPTVHVHAESSGDYWLFSVADNGIGIDPKYSEKLFVLFQRLHHKDEYAGTGIGLAICKKIVERHGGRIWLESEPSQGTTFFFTLRKDIQPTHEL